MRNPYISPGIQIESTLVGGRQFWKAQRQGGLLIGYFPMAYFPRTVDVRNVLMLMAKAYSQGFRDTHPTPPVDENRKTVLVEGNRTKPEQMETDSFPATLAKATS